MNMQVKDAVCGECGGDMVRMDDPDRTDGLQVPRCTVDPDHRGYKLKTTALTRAAPAYMDRALEGKSPILAGFSATVVIRKLMDKFPELPPQEAAIFLAQAINLNLDPFIGEFAALVFKNKNGPPSMSPMITERGWASLAHRTEPDQFAGNPSLRPITTDEEKAAWGYKPQDSVWEAEGTKLGWNHTTKVVAAFTADQQRTAIAPVKADPEHHARVKVTRRWYQENYPGCVAMVRAAQEASPTEDLKAIIEGQFKELPAAVAVDAATGEVANGHDWLQTCPEHHVDWFQSGRMPQPGHRQDGGWCNIGSVINRFAGDAFKEAAEALGWSKDETANWLRERYGGSWSKLSPGDQISAKEAAAALVVALLAGAEDAPEPAQDTTRQAPGATPGPESHDPASSDLADGSTDGQSLD